MEKTKKNHHRSLNCEHNLTHGIQFARKLRAGNKRQSMELMEKGDQT